MLVGRDREITALDGGLTQLAGRRGSVFLFSGEPGIGKTRLANEIATTAESRGMRVAWGRCWEAGGAPAFWPWHEALGSLSLKFPEFGAIATSDPIQARFSLFRDVSAELTRAADASPVVVVLEDLHAADQSSVLLLEFLATQVRTSPLMIVGTYRDLEASLRPDVGDVLARVGRASNVLALPRLGEADVAVVVRDAMGHADDKLASSVFETTHGNPLFVTEILQQVRTGTSSSTIPLGVREIIRQRLGLVPATARRVLDAAAVLGVELGMAELTRMAPDAANAIDAAIASGLVVRRGNRVRFAHALYREALYHDLTNAARQALHREAAVALSATSAPAAEIAHHFVEAGTDAAPEAIQQSIVAARAALDTFAFEDAITLLERARLAIPDGPLEPTLRAQVTIALGEARIRSGDPKGRELCVEGARLARELRDPALLALAGLAYGSVFTFGGVDPVMVEILEDALAGLPAENGLRARTMARLASARQPSPPALRDRDIVLAQEAVELGRRVATRRELLEILQSASGALYGAAHPNIRMPIARQQAQLAEELGDAPRLIAAYTRLATDYLELADMAGYEQLADAYQRLAERYGAAANPWRVPLMRSMLALSRDDFAESERWQAEAARIADTPRARRAVAYHRICFLRAAERHTELRASLGELRNLWMEMPYGPMLADARIAGSLARIGASDEVRALLAALPPAAYEESINGAALADAIACVGDSERAKQVLPALPIFATRWAFYWLDVEILEMPADHCIAQMQGLAGDWERSERNSESAMRAIEQLGRRSVIARVKFERGDLLVQCGRDLERARTMIAEARALAAELGLVELVGLIDRRHGASPQPGTVARTSTRTFAIAREGEYYAITSNRGTLRFKATRGFQYLAQLVERADTDIHVLELVGSQDADRGDAGEVVDHKAMRAYRERAEALRDVLEDAEARGNVDRAERARSELEALATELSRGSSIGGKLRRSESAVDRARSAVQRRIKDALDRIAEQDPDLGTWLRRVVHTGNHCSFQGSL
jgi:hypothetical protein